MDEQGVPLVDLGALLRGVAGLRRLLEVDLVLAAAAAQAGALDVAVDVVDADREELTRFSSRALGELGGARPEHTGS